MLPLHSPAAALLGLLPDCPEDYCSGGDGKSGQEHDLSGHIRLPTWYTTNATPHAITKL